jgi:hypothetical protein
MSTSPPPHQRSFLAAFGPLIGLCAFLVLVFSVLFLSTSKSKDESPLPSQTQATPNAIKAQNQMGAQAENLARQAAIRTKGDWSKATPEERQNMDGVSQGHGRQMLQMYYEKYGKETKPTKPK